MNPSQEPVDPVELAEPGGSSEQGALPGPVELVAPAGYEFVHPTGPQSARWWHVRRSSTRPWRRTVLVTVLSAAVVFVLGGPLGLLWAWLAPNVPVIDTGKDIVVNDPSPEEFIAADGWFTLLGLGFGLLVAIVAWLLLRRDRGPFLLVAVVTGTLGAGYWAAPWAGELIGKSSYQHWRETAVQGATYLAPPEIHSTGPMLVPAFAAAIVLTLLAGWSNDPDLDQPGAKPGYGPNNEATYGGMYGDLPAHGPNGEFPGQAAPGAYGEPGTPAADGHAGPPGAEGAGSESSPGEIAGPR